MVINFNAKCNYSDIFINTIDIKLANDLVLTFDRRNTEWSHERSGNQFLIDMQWKGCYIWSTKCNNKCTKALFDLMLNRSEDGFGSHYPDDEWYEFFKDAFEGATLINVEIEDDTPEDYEFEVIDCNINGDIDITVNC